MAAPIRFHLDEQVHPAIAIAMRARNFDVTTAAEAELLSASDEKHVEFALTEGRVIVTHDDDFLAWSAAGREHAGVCY